MSPLRSALVVGLAVVLAAAGTANAVPTDAKNDPSRPTIPQRYLDQEIAWSTCWFDQTVKALHPGAPTTRCASITVPMDWHNPDAHPDVQVAIAYSEATGTSRGLMATNPGGPGGAGLTLSAALAIDKPQLFADYDLLGFDPRGFGQSTPLRCLTTPEALAALPSTPDYRERSAQTHATEIAEAQLLADACSATEFGQFVSSQQTVYDMELLRALLADDGDLSFIGYSYGTWLGGWYADTYPERIDRFVLDSNMDWTQSQWDNVNFDPFSFQRRRDTQLFPWIARHADDIEGIGETPEAVVAHYERTRATLVSMVKAGTSSVRGDGLDNLVAGALYTNARFVRATLDILVHDEYTAAPSGSGEVEAAHVERAWARLSPELQAFETLAGTKARYGVFDGLDVDAARSVRDILADARADAAGAEADATINLGAIATTVRCNDTSWERSAKWYAQEADRMTRRYPFLGYLNGVPMCAFWPHPPQDRVLDLIDSPRMLMISGELDPATAYEGALRTHRLTQHATTLVSIDDEGQHGQYVGSASSCAEQIGDAFVFDGVVPADDVLCDTSPLPAEDVVHPVDGPVDGASIPLRGPKSVGKPDRPNPMLEEILTETATPLP